MAHPQTEQFEECLRRDYLQKCGESTGKPQGRGQYLRLKQGALYHHQAERDQRRRDCQNQELYRDGHLTEAMTFDQGTQPALRDPAFPSPFHPHTSASLWINPMGNQRAKEPLKSSIQVSPLAWRRKWRRVASNSRGAHRGIQHSHQLAMRTQHTAKSKDFSQVRI